MLQFLSEKKLLYTFPFFGGYDVKSKFHLFYFIPEVTKLCISILIPEQTTRLASIKRVDSILENIVEDFFKFLFATSETRLFSPEAVRAICLTSCQTTRVRILGNLKTSIKSMKSLELSPWTQDANWTYINMFRRRQKQLLQKLKITWESLILSKVVSHQRVNPF